MSNVFDFLGREIKVGSTVIFTSKVKGVMLKYGVVRKIGFKTSKIYWNGVDVTIQIEVKKPSELKGKVSNLKGYIANGDSEEKAILNHIFVVA